ncbi:hypothetical protein ABIA85_010039 [Bradyrhizobium sp. LA6.10]
MNTRKNKFLLTTAVLLAGMSLASAQSVRENAGGRMSAGGGAGGMNGAGGAREGAAEYGRSGGATCRIQVGRPTAKE